MTGDGCHVSVLQIVIVESGLSVLPDKFGTASTTAPEFVLGELTLSTSRVMTEKIFDFGPIL